MILLDVMRATPSRWDFRKKRKTALGSELLLAEQTRLLEMIARGCGLRECLEALTESTSRLAPAARSAILVANEQRSLMADAVSVHLPAGFSLSVRGLPIDELPIGTCGEAIRAMRVLWPEDVAASVIETFKHTLSTGKAYFSRDFVSQRADIEAVEGYEWELHRLTLPDGTQGTICYYFDATDLRSAQQALEEAERVKSAQLSELENLYRTSPIGLAVLDGDGRFLRINQALADMNGLPLEAHIGRIAWDLVPNLRRAVEPVLKRVIENGETIVAEIVATTPRWYNQERTWKETWYPVRNVEGAKVAGGVIVEDITDQKKAEETRQLLVHELNHRAKNMLAMVQSIAHQSLRHARDPAEFGESFMGRLQSLARAHTLLTQSDWRSADVSTVAKNQLMLDVESDPRIALSGPKVFLTPQLALQLSLILHELATNARKHGSLRASHGEVHLTWTLNNARPDKTLGFRWEERCGEARPEAVAGAGGGGFGMTLIKSLSPAGATLTDRPDGILWEFALPWRETAPSPLRLGLAPGASTRRDADVDIAGLDLLLVEDEPLISMDLQARLEGVGVHVVGPAGSISEALELLRAGGRVEMALLDMNLRGDSVEPVARQLGEKQIPFAYLTGYGNAPLAQEAKVPIIPKPFDFAQVIEVLRSLRERRA